MVSGRLKQVDARRDFSSGELDPQVKRNDENPQVKTGGRQMSNWRILESKILKNRPGRSAKFLVSSAKRIEKIQISSGVFYYFVIGGGACEIRNADGTVNTSFATSNDPLNEYTLAIINKSVFLASTNMGAPFIFTWDGVNTWTLSVFTCASSAGFVKQAPFYRFSPLNVTMLPSARLGTITLTFSSPICVPGMVNTLMRYIGCQMLITAFISPTQLTAVVIEQLYDANTFLVGTIHGSIAAGDEVIGSVSGQKGIVTVAATTMTVQLISPGIGYFGIMSGTPDTIVGPNGNAAVESVVTTGVTPQAIGIWDEEVMNNLRGWPRSVFADQNRLGLCDLPGLPRAVLWSQLGVYDNFNVQADPTAAIFELVPGSSRVLYVVPGMENSEFVFCDNAVIYIPISETNPLKPGSVAFKLISRDGSQRVEPRALKDHIVYISSGQQTSINAITAIGAFNRPYETAPLTELHAHLLSNPIAISVLNSDPGFPERYVYICNSNGSVMVARYTLTNGNIQKDVVGWVPWTGAGSTFWLTAQGSSLLFGTVYFGTVFVIEQMDDTQFLDASVLVNAPPAALAPPGGMGALWWLAGQSAFLYDGQRPLGTYQIDNNGAIIPQFQGGENLASVNLRAGQPWTAVFEPFMPGVQVGQDVQQRIARRHVCRIAAYVMQSSGFVFARLFSRPLTLVSPAQGTIENVRRIAAYNQDDDATQPPPLREQTYTWRPIGRSHDPRVAIIKDTPGPLQIAEISLEVTV